MALSCDVWSIAASFLGVQELSSFACSCTIGQRLAHNRGIWRALLRTTSGVVSILEEGEQHPRSIFRALSMFSWRATLRSARCVPSDDDDDGDGSLGGAAGSWSSRFLHRAAAVGNSTYVFGGKGNDGGRFYNDLWKFDDNDDAVGTGCSLAASRVAMLTDRAPPPRAAHSMVTIGAHLVVFGGLSHRQTYLNDVWAIDTRACGAEMMAWTLLRSVRADTLRPEPRMGHSANAMDGTSSFVIFGGSAPRRVYNDVRIFDLATRCWRVVAPSGTAPSGRSGHAAVWLGQGRAPRTQLLIVGGNDLERTFSESFVLTFESAKFRNAAWSTLKTRSGVATPPPKIGHSAIAFGRWVVLSGGRNKHQATGEILWSRTLWIYDADARVWRELPDVACGARTGHCCVRSSDGTRIALLGGLRAERDGETGQHFHGLESIVELSLDL